MKRFIMTVVISIVAVVVVAVIKTVFKIDIVLQKRKIANR